MADRNTTVSITLRLDDGQAKLELEALQEKADRTRQSLEEMQQKLLDPSKWGSDDTSETIKAEIKRTEKDLKSMEKMIKNRETMIKGIEQVLGDISNSNYNELTKTRGLMLSAIRGLNPTTEAYQTKVAQLQQLQEEIAERQRTLNNRMSDEKAAEVLAKPGDYSTDELKEAIEVTRKLQSAQQIGKDEWEKYGKAINNAENLLHHYNSEAKKSVMSSRLATIDTASPASLSEQKRYWQDMVRANPAIEEYKNNLQEVVNVERERIKVLAERSMAKVNEEDYSESIEDMQQRLKLLREYRNIVDKTEKVQDPVTGEEVKRIDQIDASIKRLNNSIRQCEQGYLSMADALKAVDDIDEFEGTIEDLEKLKKRLEEIRNKELKLGDKGSRENIDKINAGLFKVEGKLKDVNAKAKSLDEILDNVGESSLSDLERAAKELEEQIAKVGRQTEEYVLKSAKLRDVNKYIDSIKANFKEKESIIIRTGKRLASYVAVYAGFNEVVGQISRVVRANLELSDSLADIQKTTGLTGTQVGKLSDQINAIDTRTAQDQLHALAYEAGKLGISAEEDVLAFVKAGNQLVVALGEDLGGAEAVRELMKVNAILGETDNLGMEKALLSTGSAINEISQTSRASAGPIADVVSRIGAIGASAKLQMSDLIALAGTADALGQSAEVAGTAFNKFITTLQTNTVNVAYALGLDPQNLRAMLDAGQTMEAIIMIFERMNQMGDLSTFGGIFKELGSDGARMSQVLTTMAAGVEELKSQVFTSNKAFREATSVTNEYNIKNESAAAILERMGNNLREAFTNSGFVEWIRDVLQWLYYLPQRIEENRLALLAWNTLLVEIVMISGARFVKFISVELVGAFKSLIVTIRALAIEQAAIKWKAYTAEMWKVASVTTKLKYAVQALWSVISKNPFVALMAAVGAVVALFKTFREEVSENVKAHAELETAVQNEQATMRKLMNDINNANSATGERAALIKELNNKYGNYLGFLVTESNYIENQAYIYDLLNAKLRETIALKMDEKRMGDIAEKYQGRQVAANKKLQENLSIVTEGDQTDAAEMMSHIMTEVRKEAEKGGSDINAILQNVLLKTSEDFRKGMENIDSEITSGKLVKGSEMHLAKINSLASESTKGYSNMLLSNINELLDVEKSMNKELQEWQRFREANTKASQNLAKDVTKAHLDSQFSTLTGKESIDQLKTLKQQTESYIKAQQDGVADLIQKKTALKGLTYAEQQEYEKLEKQIYGTVEVTDEMGDRTEQAVKPAQDLINRYNFLNHKKEVGLRLSDEEEEKIEAANAEIKRMEKNLVGVNEQLAESGHINAWGTSKDLENMSGKELAALYDKLESDAGLLAADASEGIQTQFWKNFSTRDKAVAWYKEQSKAVEAQLRKLGMDTNAHWLKDRGSNEKKTAQQLYRELLAELEAYYNERETFIRRKGMEEGRLESEINRDIENLKIQEWNDRIELEKALLDKFYKQSTFDPTKYMGDLTKMPYFAGVNMEEVRQVIQAAGPKLEADIVKSMTGSMVKVEEKLYQIKQRIERILLEDDFSEQVAQQYLQSLDQLGLLFNVKTETEDHSEEEGERRLAIMKEWADKAYQMDSDGLKRLVKSNELFRQWRIGRTQEDYDALLMMLRKYHDDAEEATKKSYERQKKIAEQQFQKKDPKTGKSQEDVANERIEGEEADLNMYESARDLGLASQRRVDDAQIAVLNARIKKEQELMEVFKLRMEMQILAAEQEMTIAQNTLRMLEEQGLAKAEHYADFAAKEQAYQDLIAQRDLGTNEAYQRISEYEQQIQDVELSITERKLNNLKQYTDAVVTFGEQMGEAAFGEVEDRKEAAKQLLKTTLQLTKDLIMAEVKRLIMKKALEQQEVVQEQVKEQQITLTKGEHQIANLSADAAAAQGENAINTSRAGGKTLAELGWWGIPLIAVISAALSALLGAAMGAFSKAKSEVSAATGASSGRLATGMLTYAEGNYPVLGNDGNVYNAKYEGSGMKTGIYRGGAHFGIFSEKKPEAIIDGDTTQRLIMNHPDIWKAIVTLSKNGRLDSGMGMRTFATGNIDQLAKQASQAETQAAAAQNEAQNAMMERMEALLAANVNLMNKLATEGVQSRINMYGDDGLFKNMEKAKKYANRVGYR